jgi:hypothetical protein
MTREFLLSSVCGFIIISFGVIDGAALDCILPAELCLIIWAYERQIVKRPLAALTILGE